MSTFTLLIHIACLHFTVTQISYPIFFNEDEVRDVRDIESDLQYSIENASVCDEDKLIGKLADLRVTTPESIIRMSLLDGQILCSDILNQINEVRRYMKSCHLHSTNLYKKLLMGIVVLIKYMCYDASYFEEFELYFFCIKDLDKDFEICAGPLDWNEEHSSKKVCRIFKKMADCYYIKIAKVCGLGGAGLFKKLVIAVVNEVISCPCDVSKNPEVKDAMPDVYIKKSMKNDPLDMVEMNTPSPYLIIFCVVFIYKYYN